MGIRYFLGAAVLCLAVNLPANAQVSTPENSPFEKLETIAPEVLFKGLIREDDVSLLFQHLRESMAASTRGEEALPGEAMKRRSEQIQRDVAARGSVLLGVLLTAFESAAKQIVREGFGDFYAKPAPRESPFPR